MVKTDRQSLRKRQSFSYGDDMSRLSGPGATTAPAQAPSSQQGMPAALADANTVASATAVGVVTGMPATAPTHSQGPRRAKPEMMGRSQKADANTLQMPKQRRSAASAPRTPLSGQARAAANAGSSVALVKERAQTVVAAPGSAMTVAQAKPLHQSGKAQLIEKYKAEAAAWKQAQTEATTKRAYLVAETLQHADFDSSPSSSDRQTPNVRKQQAAPKAMSASGHMRKLPATLKGANLQQANAEMQTAASEGGSAGSSAHRQTVHVSEMLQSRNTGLLKHLQHVSEPGND